MNFLKGIKFLLFSRGIKRWIERLKTINKRFGFTPKKQIGIIDEFRGFLKQHNLRGNFFIPATILERYIKDIKKINDGTIEWGIHGYVHTDHSQLSENEQKIQIVEAIKIFDKNQIKFTGFRCPYLKFNEHTHKILKETGRFLFDSSDSIIWDDVYDAKNNYYNWIRTFYNPQIYQKGMLSLNNKQAFARIAVSLPDDDVMVDREKRSSNQILHIWSKILKKCYENNEIFVLQIHPERFLDLRGVLNSLIKQARSYNPPFLITTLSEVAKLLKKPEKKYFNNHKGIFCITGDIDAITFQDFVIRLIDW